MLGPQRNQLGACRLQRQQCRRRCRPCRRRRRRCRLRQAPTAPPLILPFQHSLQLYKLWRTKSAKDLSYTYLWLYAVGLLFITVYLYLEKATVGWICECIETGACLAVV